MARWNRGDPYPEDWPEWLKGADIEWCVVDIDSRGYVTWRDGVWHSGNWRGGTWLNGSWHNGIWLSGTWWGGTWHNGTWWGGTWLCGTWKSGTWLNGVWENGTWHSGTWESGTWRGGTWLNGSWHNGIWLSGTWKSGHQRKPRFGWSLDPDGLILGFDGEFWESKTAEEWQPLLESMPLQKTQEFHLLLAWKNGLTCRPQTNHTPLSVWEAILED